MGEIIDGVKLKELIMRFDPDIQDIFYDVCGSELEAIPQNWRSSNISMEQFLESLLKLNNVRSQKIILMRIGFLTGATMTLQEVADVFGITQKRVQQIESKFIRYFIAHARPTKFQQT